jgi:hypothetical protein
MTENAEICMEIYTVFKKLCFDLHVIKKYPGLNIKTFNKVGSQYMEDKMTLNLKRFKNIKKAESLDDININHKILIAEELKTFLKTCGCDASDAEINTMLHYVEKLEYKSNKLSLCDLFEIWGSVMNFAKLDPYQVFKYVLEYFSQYEIDEDEMKPISNFYSRDMNIKHIEKFLNVYNSYFENKDYLQYYIMKEVKKLDEFFSPESLTLTIIGPLSYFKK